MNTSSCRVTFPLTVGASATATVQITYAASGQTYGGGAYAQDGEWSFVTENNGGTAADYPYYVTFDHAAYVTASRSQASGADIRVWVDGVEVDRALSGANTSTCKVWFPIALSANSTSVVAITVAASGYDYAGGSYTKLFDLSTTHNHEPRVHILYHWICELRRYAVQPQADSGEDIGRGEQSGKLSGQDERCGGSG